MFERVAAEEFDRAWLMVAAGSLCRLGAGESAQALLFELAVVGRADELAVAVVSRSVELACLWAAQALGKQA